MTMTLAEGLLTVALVVLGTMATRFLPFMIFPANKPTPKYIRYLSTVLPYAVIGLLVIYCPKNVTVMQSPFGFPEGIAILAVIGLHIWRKNMLLSIAGGTVLYMPLVQVVFI